MASSSSHIEGDEEDRRSPPFHRNEAPAAASHSQSSSCIPPLHPSAIDQTPVMAPSARHYSHPIPPSIFTPEAYQKSTPLTVQMTPEYEEEEDADDPSSIAKQLLTAEGGMFDTSSTEAADSSKSSEYTPDDVRRLGREPSQPTTKRYHRSYDLEDRPNDDSYDSPNNSMHSSNRSFDRVYADGSPYRSSNGTDAYSLSPTRDSYAYQPEKSRHAPQRKHHLRSRRATYYVTPDIVQTKGDSKTKRNLDCPLAVVKLANDEFHPAVDMQYLITDSEEEEDEDVFLLAEDSSERFRRDSVQFKPRRSSSSLRRSSKSPKPAVPLWRSFSQRISSTQTLVWLLCFVGLTSVTMMVTLNHQMARMSTNEHLAVLFPHPLSYSSKGFVAPPPTLKKPSEPHAVRGAAQVPAEPSNRRTVNLNHLAQVLPNKDDKQIVVSSITKRTDSHHNDHHHHRHSDKHDKHHHDHGEHRESHSKRHRHHHEDAAPETHHSQRLYIPTRPGIMGIEDIPPVIQPSVWDDDAVQAAFDLDDPSLLDWDEETATESIHPRVVFLHGTFPPTKERSIRRYRSEFTDSTQLYPFLDSEDERVASTMELRAPFVQGECVPMKEWQTTFNPSCNGMHELDMASMGDDRTEDDFKLFGMNGFWRNAWRYDSTGGHSSLAERDTVVLKTLRINHRFEDAYFENNRIDAVVLERLTASPHVINVFGFCGHSVITEFADGKRLGELADKMAKVPLARLQIARDIANGLADVHGIDGDGNATFVHLDINPANVVSIGGTLKLNDFNIGVLRRWNTTSNTPCGIPAKYPNPQWRSPEEARLEQNLTEKVDVFSLGHIFFRLICGHEPWHKLEPGGMPSKEALNEKVKQGILPTIPQDIMNSYDPEIMAIRDAMLRCYTYDPVSRPSAREIAIALQESLNMLEMQAATEVL